jgi:Mrp family chromosome partitioning ATPase
LKPGKPLQSAELMQEFERLREELPARYIAVTGARGGEGVTTAAVGIARALAARGPTLLAEGHLRQPTLAQQLGIQGAGLLDWDRSGPLPVHDLPGAAGVAVLCGGHGSAAPQREDDIQALLGAAAQQARTQFAQVVWDTPPLTLHPDILILAPHIEGALVVVEMDGSRVDELHFLREVLARAQIPIIGSLLNRSGRYWPRPRRRPVLGVAR